MTIFAARNVCRSIFSSSCVVGSSGIGALEQHLREARDAGQRRVDLVRDAGGEQADGGHLLGDLQLLFEIRASVMSSSTMIEPAIGRRPRLKRRVATLMSSARAPARAACVSGTR